MSAEPPSDGRRFLAAVGLYGGFHALTALAIAAPVAAALGRVTGRYPRGDAELFDRGSVMLLEALRRVGEQGGVLRAAVIWEAGIAWILSFFVLAVALALVAAPRGDGARGTASAATRALPALALLALLAILAQAVAVGVFGGTGVAVMSALKGHGSGAIVAAIVSGVLTALGLLVLGVMHDVARVAILAERTGPLLAIQRAFKALRRSGVRWVWAYLWRTLLGVAALLVALVWAPHLRERAGTAFPALFVHQLALAIVAWMRIAWLAAAARRLAALATEEGAPGQGGSGPSRGDAA